MDLRQLVYELEASLGSVRWCLRLEVSKATGGAERDKTLVTGCAAPARCALRDLDDELLRAGVLGVLNAHQRSNGDELKNDQRGE